MLSADTVFGLYVSQKQIYKLEIWHARFTDMVLHHIFRFWEILDFEKKKVTKNLSLSFGHIILLGGIRDSHCKDLFILRLLVLFVCILLKISIFGDFFLTFGNFRPRMAGHWVT